MQSLHAVWDEHGLSPPHPGEALRSMLRGLRIKPADFAREVDVSTEVIASMLARTEIPPLSTLRRFSRVLSQRDQALLERLATSYRTAPAGKVDTPSPYRPPLVVQPDLSPLPALRFRAGKRRLKPADIAILLKTLEQMTRITDNTVVVVGAGEAKVHVVRRTRTPAYFDFYSARFLIETLVQPAGRTLSRAETAEIEAIIEGLNAAIEIDRDY